MCVCVCVLSAAEIGDILEDLSSKYVLNSLCWSLSHYLLSFTCTITGVNPHPLHVPHLSSVTLKLINGLLFFFLFYNNVVISEKERGREGGREGGRG